MIQNSITRAIQNVLQMSEEQFLGISLKAAKRLGN